MRGTQRLQRAFDEYIRRTPYSGGCSFSFTYDGAPVSGDDTPDHLGLPLGAVLQAVQMVPRQTPQLLRRRQQEKQNQQQQQQQQQQRGSSQM
jgi:hypothetical protein